MSFIAGSYNIAIPKTQFQQNNLINTFIISIPTISPLHQTPFGISIGETRRRGTSIADDDAQRHIIDNHIFYTLSLECFPLFLFPQIENPNFFYFLFLLGVVR